MKRVSVFMCAAGLAAAAGALALGLPGGGGGQEIDTATVDEVIAEVKALDARFGAVESKIKNAEEVLNDVAQNHSEMGDLTDATTLAAIRGVMTPDERDQLRAASDSLMTVPTDLDSVAKRLPDLTAKTTAALTDLATQIQNNPAAAASLKGKQDQLNEGKAALEAVAQEGPDLVAQSDHLITAFAAILN